MSSELVANKILLWLGEIPESYAQPDDKWPAIFAIVFFHILPIALGLLFISPLFWLWFKKKKWTLRNLGLAILQGVALVIIGLMLLFFFAAYLQGKAFEALNGIS